VATGQAKPNGQIQVSNGLEKPFLAPLSIRKIPMIGEKMHIQLRNMGITHAGLVQEMDIELMERVLGENGVTVWKKCNGIDNSPVIPYSERKSISKEETFDKDTINMEVLRKTIARMVDELAFDLRKSQILTSCIAVKIRYSDFHTEQAQQRITYTASTAKLTEKALELFKKLYTRRVLLRLVGVKFSNLVHGLEQIDIFNDVATQINLNKAMDSIRARFGQDKVMKAITF
jgi:DNA polymerase-4